MYSGKVPMHDLYGIAINKSIEQVNIECRNTLVVIINPMELRLLNSAASR